MDNPLILQLLQKLHYLSFAHKTIHLCWIPSHIGILAIEAADMAAKESLDQDITVSQGPYTDLKSHINRFISSKWQERWSSYRHNKPFQIKPTLGEWPPGFRKSRKEEVLLSRLRIGRTYFSYSYILRREDPPECTACQEICSVTHVLIDCIDLGLVRPRFYTVPGMKVLFDTVSVDRILSFVKEIILFQRSKVLNCELLYYYRRDTFQIKTLLLIKSPIQTLNFIILRFGSTDSTLLRHFFHRF